MRSGAGSPTRRPPGRSTRSTGVPGHGGSFSGPGGPTIVDGMLFTGSGYSILGGAPGNVLLAFRLD